MTGADKLQAGATYFRRTRYLSSAARLDQAPPDTGLEVAFAGRSNAGKSSAINTLCEHKGLARTSKTPGRTQLLNFFFVDEQRRLVDLPGYGYAKVSATIKRDWQGTLADYLERRKCLQGLMLMMDARHPLKEYDRQLLGWADEIGVPIHVLLTKADKLNKGSGARTLLEVQRELTSISPKFSAQLYSSLKRTGVSETYRVLNDWLKITEPAFRVTENPE